MPTHAMHRASIWYRQETKKALPLDGGKAYRYRGGWLEVREVWPTSDKVVP